MDLAAMYGSILQKCPLFEGLSEAEMSRFLTCMDAVRRDCRKGEILHTAGETFARFGLVLGGVVQVFTDDMSGEQMIMANVSAGGTFGEALCYLRVPEPPVYVRAEEDTVLLLLTTDAIRNGADPKLTERFTAMMAKKLLRMNDRIQILSKGSIRRRLVTFFTEYEHECGSRTFSVPFDRSSMARYLGTDRAALSRELSRMRSEGLIDYYKNTFRLLPKDE